MNAINSSQGSIDTKIILEKEPFINSVLKCSGADCSNLLTSEEICYCSPCSAQQDQIWKNLEKNQQDINQDLANFNQGLNDYVENQKDNAGNSNLKQSPTSSNNQELDAKKQQLKDLQSKEKSLTKSLPIDTQISILQKEISNLEKNSNKNHIETALLADKKQQLAELLKKQSNSDANTTKPSDKTALYVGLGIIGVVLIEYPLEKRSEIKELNISYDELYKQGLLTKNEHLEGSLDIRHFPSLEKFDCKNNRLTSLTLTSLYKLMSVDCSDNQINDISTELCMVLNELMFHNNPLKSLDI
ncbi:10682_t:CDS:2, partial [Funneliformis geosporum]